MLPRLSGGLALTAALAAAAVTCKGDPTATGVGSATGIQTSLSSINVNIGATARFTAWVVDVRLNRVEAGLTFRTCDATILTVATDTSYHPVPVTSAQGLVSSVKSGTSCVHVSSPGLPDSTVVVNVLPLAPTVATSRNMTSGILGATLSDTARLAGGFGTLSGKIVFQLFDSTRAKCDSFPRFVDTLTVIGAGIYHTSPDFTTDKLGAWRWTATYSGDANNKGVTTGCNAEQVAIQAVPTLTTSAAPTTGVLLTDTLRDTATLAGGSTPTGTIIFRLFRPNSALCTSAIFADTITDTVKVAGNRVYVAKPGFLPDTAGTWRWTAEYSGNPINQAVVTGCNAEPVAIAGLPPGAGTGTGGGHGPAPVVLGAAGNYVILAKSGISNVPTSAITGSLGLSPAAASFITGFALTLPAGGAASTSAQVTGLVYASDYAAPTPANLTTAVSNMQTAYVDAAGRPLPDHTELAAGNLGGLTLPAGLYKWSNTVIIPTNVTLSGGANDTWIFQIAGGLTESAATKVILTGGALAQNVVWQVQGVVDVGTTADLEGEVLSLTAITLHTGATVNGRLLAQTAVTLAGNTVVQK